MEAPVHIESRSRDATNAAPDSLDGCSFHRRVGCSGGSVPSCPPKDPRMPPPERRQPPRARRSHPQVPYTSYVWRTPGRRRGRCSGPQRFKSGAAGTQAARPPHSEGSSRRVGIIDPASGSAPLSTGRELAGWARAEPSWGGPAGASLPSWAGHVEDCRNQGTRGAGRTAPPVVGEAAR